MRYVLKPEFQVIPASDDNSRATMAVPREHALLDLAAVNLADVDAATIIRDCEIVAKAARENFADLQRIITAFGADGTPELQAEALAIAERLGLTESAVAKNGGGLLVIAGACLFASCFASCPNPHVVIYGMPMHPSYFLVGAALTFVFLWFGLLGALVAHAGCNFGLLSLALFVEFWG